MSYESFIHEAEGRTPGQAFRRAVRKAEYLYGHSGGTGTIAEKDSYLVIRVPKGEDPMTFVQRLMDEDDDRIAEKWGPAGCVRLRDGLYCFFGWADS